MIKHEHAARSLCLSSLLAACAFAEAGQAKLERRAGTAQVLDATWSEAACAISNLFEHVYDHRLLLIEVPHPLTEAGRRLTNGWLATPSIAQLADVKRGTKIVPYFAEFHIAAVPVGRNQCRITVLTLDAWVHDGKEIGHLGGWAYHGVTVPPVVEEETNLLAQIARELRWRREGATNMASTNAPPKTMGLYGMSGKEEAEFKAALKAAEAARAKSGASGNDTNAAPPRK